MTYNDLNLLFTDLDSTLQKYSNQSPQQRVDTFYATCFTKDMLTDSPIKNLASNSTLFALNLQNYLKINNITYKNFIENLDLPNEQAELLLQFEYDFNTLKPIGGPSKLSDKPVNKSIINLYSKTILTICTALGAVGTFVQPFVDIQTSIIENKQKEIENNIEIQKLYQKNRELDQKDRELDLYEKNLKLEEKK